MAGCCLNGKDFWAVLDVVSVDVDVLIVCDGDDNEGGTFCFLDVAW